MERQKGPRESVATKSRKWLVVAGVFATVSVMVLLALGIGLVSASGVTAQSIKDTCPIDAALTASIAPPQSSYDSHQVLNIKYNVSNDQDSGLVGYWALDYYTVSVRGYLITHGPLAGDYNVTQSFSGDFVSVQGALSPQNGVVEDDSVFGTWVGVIPATLSGVSFPNGSAYPISGWITAMGQSFHYGGTVSNLSLDTYGAQGQFVSPTIFDPFTTYFVGANLGNGQQFQTNYGFNYELNSEFKNATSSNTWCDYQAGDAGDIVA